MPAKGQRAKGKGTISRPLSRMRRIEGQDVQLVRKGKGGALQARKVDHIGTTASGYDLYRVSLVKDWQNVLIVDAAHRRYTCGFSLVERRMANGIAWKRFLRVHKAVKGAEILGLLHTQLPRRPAP